jgi:hypothetical protein
MSRLALSSNELNQASTWPTSPWSSIRCVQNDFWGCGTFGTNSAPILRQDYHYLRMDWIKHPLEPRYLGVPSGASITIFEPMVCLAQTYTYLAPTPTLSPNGPKWDSTLTHVTLEFHRVRPKWFLSLWYVRRKPRTFFASRLALYQMNWIKHPLQLRHLGVLSGASKTNFEPTVCLAQTMHLSW